MAFIIFFVISLICLLTLFLSIRENDRCREVSIRYESRLRAIDIEGESAYWNGIPEENVPYELGSDEHRAWIEGWECAECDHLFDRQASANLINKWSSSGLIEKKPL